MKKISTHLYATYNRYVDALRAIPWHNDALKPVEKRIIFAAFQVAKSYVKAVKIVGTAIVYHPHGDKTIYDSLVSLVNRNILEGQGNYGCEGLHPTPPAAARYVEAKINPQFSKLFSQYLNFVPWKVLEIEKEPLFLPSIIPIGLIGSGVIQGVGGVNITKIPKYNFLDLIKRLISLVTREKNPIIIKPIIPNCNVLEDTIGDFDKILTTGKGTLQIIPQVDIKNTHINIYGKNPITGFKKLLSYNEKYEQKNKITYFETIDLSKENKIEIQVIPRKGKVDNVFAQKILKLISVKVHIVCNLVVDDLTVKTLSIDKILLNCFTQWKKAWEEKLKLDLSNLKNKKSELIVVQIIRNILINNPHLKKIKDIAAIYKSNIEYQQKNVQVEDIEKVCKKHSIEKLIETEINLTQINNDIVTIQNNINNISTLALQTLKSLK